MITYCDCGAPIPEDGPSSAQCGPCYERDAIAEHGAWMLRRSQGWTKTDEGYRWGNAVLIKRPGGWVLIYQGLEVALPGRATFDHAEHMLRELIA